MLDSRPHVNTNLPNVGSMPELEHFLLKPSWIPPKFESVQKALMYIGIFYSTFFLI